MIKLDDNLLQELGLGALPPEEKKKMLAHIYETLEMRVGMELAKQMTDAQLMEFEQFINRNDEAGALQWLESNFPNYRDVVAAEFEKLKAEIRQAAPQIMASAAQQAAQPQMPPPQQPAVDPYAPQAQPGQQYGPAPQPHPQQHQGYAAPQPPAYPQQPVAPAHDQQQQYGPAPQQPYPQQPQGPQQPPVGY
jgi:hypothetical protein